MLRQGFVYTLFGALAVVLSGLAQMPAHRVLALAGDTGPLRLAGPSGTLWSGRARDVRLAGRRLGALHWRWQPLQLLRARVGLAVSTDAPALTLAGRLDLPVQGGLPELADVALDADAALSGLPVQGRVVGDVAALAWNGAGAPVGTADLVWRDAASVLLRGLELGDIGLLLADEGTGGIATRGAAEVDARVSGELENTGRGVHYRVDLQPATVRGREALAGLRGLGRAVAGGGVRFEGDWSLQL